MAELQGVNVERLQGGLGRTNAGTDNHVAYIVGNVPAGAVATAVANDGKGVVLKSVFDAKTIGINESFDANNNLKIYNQIDEFFRLAPEATLYLFNSDVTADVKAFLNYNKEIKGYALNTSSGDVATEVAKHQNIINEFALVNRLIDFCYIGMDGLDDFTTDLYALTSGQVSVCVACEDDDSKVSMGSVLGMLAVRKVNENLGSVDITNKPREKRGTVDYTLTDTLKNRWLTAYLSDGREIGTVDNAELQSIISKGYIVVAGYEGYPGMFFENSYTCIERASDFAFTENNRTWNKAARLIRNTLLPRVKGIVKKDPSTGYIATTTVSSWEQLLRRALESMVVADEISGYDVSINPNQTVSASNPCIVKASVVADGIVHEFEVQVGLTNSI